jgi:hypothetical protein
MTDAQLALFADQPALPPKRTRRTGPELRDAGMTQAIKHAEEVRSDWGARAFKFVEIFARRRIEFRAEQVREYAEQKGLESPPSKRAWGAVISKAVRRKLIHKVRFEPCENPKAHSCNVVVWLGNGANE